MGSRPHDRMHHPWRFKSNAKRVSVVALSSEDCLSQRVESRNLGKNRTKESFALNWEASLQARSQTKPGSDWFIAHLPGVSWAHPDQSHLAKTLTVLHE